MPEDSGAVMAFDFGERRIGVAIGETLLGNARPLTTIAAASGDERFAAIGRLIEEWRPQRLVVGLPRHADGGERPHAVADRCRRFARQLGGRFRLPVLLCDERFSTCAAAVAIADDKTLRKAGVDAAAAAVILQAWFDQQQHATAASH